MGLQVRGQSRRPRAAVVDCPGGQGRCPAYNCVRNAAKNPVEQEGSSSLFPMIEPRTRHEVLHVYATLSNL